MKQQLKVCFAASSGGHFEQLMNLKPLMERYDSFILTEKTEYALQNQKYTVRFVSQINRKEAHWKRTLLRIFGQSLRIFWKERPDVIITTGVLAMIPMCLLVKLTGGKVIFIESYAKSTSPTETGKLVYRFADYFYVQWETMQEFYPKAKFLGGIY